MLPAVPSVCQQKKQLRSNHQRVLPRALLSLKGLWSAMPRPSGPHAASANSLLAMDISLISCNREYFGQSYTPSGPWRRQGWRGDSLHWRGHTEEALDNPVVCPLLCLPFVNNHDQELGNIVPERTISGTNGEAEDKTLGLLKRRAVAECEPDSLA